MGSILNFISAGRYRFSWSQYTLSHVFSAGLRSSYPNHPTPLKFIRLWRSYGRLYYQSRGSSGFLPWAFKVVLIPIRERRNPWNQGGIGREQNEYFGKAHQMRVTDLYYADGLQDKAWSAFNCLRHWPVWRVPSWIHGKIVNGLWWESDGSWCLCYTSGETHFIYTVEAVNRNPFSPDAPQTAFKECNSRSKLLSHCIAIWKLGGLAPFRTKLSFDYCIR